MRKLLITAAVLCSFLAQASTGAFAVDHFKMLEVKVGDQKHTGRVMLHNDEVCWLLKRDGRLQEIDIGTVTGFSEHKDRFRSLTQIELKSALREEFGKSFDISTTQHYVVVAPTGTSERFAAIFEQIYRDFVRSLRTRGLKVDEPEFPLAAVVLPNQAAFFKYCKGDKMPAINGLMGYYLKSSNRVALFQHRDSEDVDSTVIHEATHQVAFNTGIHSRVAEQQKWVIEGLATVFEADGVRHRGTTSSLADRVNRERYLWFLDYAKSRRAANGIEAIVRDNNLFSTAILDAYAESWALTFFLLETRPADYSKFLKIQVAREPFKDYDSATRLKDFQAVFGRDLAELDAQLVRYIRKIGN